MSQSCVWPKGIIYEKLETLVEDVVGNSGLETLAIKADHKGKLDYTDNLGTDYFCALICHFM